MFFFIHKRNEYKTGIQLSIGTQIGPGLMFAHFSATVIHPGAVIADNCTIFTGVTIGSVRGKGIPVIGSNVVLATGAKVLGNVKIGNNVMIGANSVVVKDIPENSVVGGVPAKVLNMDGQKHIKLYL